MDGVCEAVKEGASSSNEGEAANGQAEEQRQEEGDEDRQESRKPTIARRPNKPTQAEVDAHMPLHLEFRSWCPHCVAGKGVASQHRASTEENNGKAESQCH